MILDKLLSFWQSIDFAEHPYYYLDVFVVAIIFYYLYQVVKGTRAIPIITGIVILAAFSIVADKLHLATVSWLLSNAMTIMVIAIPVVLRDEFRKALEKLGNVTPFKKPNLAGQKEVIKNVSAAAKDMAEKKIGATIVISKDVNLKEYIDTGVILKAEVAFPLLMNIFFPKSPLHDGAVIIEGTKITAAACVLPLSMQTKDYGLGTRHKSALGLSEQTDAAVIAVSEEKGRISLAYEGNLWQNLAPARLEKTLQEILLPQKRKR